jgi:hypothetical protein
MSRPLAPYSPPIVAGFFRQVRNGRDVQSSRALRDVRAAEVPLLREYSLSAPFPESPLVRYTRGCQPERLPNTTNFAPVRRPDG